MVCIIYLFFVITSLVQLTEHCIRNNKKAYYKNLQLTKNNGQIYNEYFKTMTYAA